MKKRVRRLLALFAGMGMVVSMSACSSVSAKEGDFAQGTEQVESQTETEAKGEEKELEDLSAQAKEAMEEATGTIYVQGYEWGPGVPKVILKAEKAFSELDVTSAKIATAGMMRTVTDAYLSDEKGNKVSEASPYITIEMETTYEASGSPFTYDFMETMQNDWSDTYEVAAYIEGKQDGEDSSLGLVKDLISNRICPDAELFTDRGSYSGTYQNPMTGEEEELTLQFAAYESEDLEADGEKNPLIIWLHGQGEGGTDPDIAILGNQVTALAKDEIQSYFTTENGANGAYVLAVQTPTYWMDGGDGTNSNGDLVSRYTEILMDTIQDYLDQHEDVDTNRIYLGGCSNGGYMTMNMAVEYPDVWAALYPCCEAYSYNCYERDEDGNYKIEETTDSSFGTYIRTEERWFTDEKLEAIKNLPIWFIQSADDTTVLPENFAEPTYQALLNAGAENKWFSMFETVQGTDDSAAEYFGHWSWIYIFHNQVTKVQDTDSIRNATDESYGFTPSNDGGGSQKATEDGTEYDSLFAWLNAQGK